MKSIHLAEGPTMPTYLPATTPAHPQGAHLLGQPSGHSDEAVPQTAPFPVYLMSGQNGFGADWLPVGERERAVPASERESIRVPGRRHVVIMDRDPNVLEILGQLFADENYDVTLFASFPNTDELSRREPDVIIADAAFNHDPDGACLRDDTPRRADGTAIPIVYCTTSPEIAARLRDHQVPILLKPFDLDELLDLVRQDDR